MKLYFLPLLILFFSYSIYAQKTDGVEVNGKIVINTTNDKEGVTVYNTSSNKGTITDAEGRFIIKVALNDVVEISALQFKKFTVIIDQKIIDSKQMTVVLVEQVNKLDEVVILPYDLTGDLVIDVESVKTFNPDLDAIYFGVNDVSTYEFGDDYKSGVKNTVMPTGVDNVFGANLLGVVGLLINTIFPKKDKKNFTLDRRDVLPKLPTKDLRDYYNTDFIVNTFNIKESSIEAFIGFTEINNLDYSLLQKGKELEFLELVKKQSDLFLKTGRD